MECSTPTFDVNMDPAGFLIDLDSLYAHLARLRADAAQLLQVIHSHWGIANGLHYRRDETLREDRCHSKHGQAPRALAVINNLIVGLTVRLGWTNLAAARRYFDAHPHQAQRLVLQRLSDF